MDNQSPTEKAIAMAQRMEELERGNEQLWKDLYKEREKHKQEMRVQEAYVLGIKATLEALLNRSVNL